MALFAQGNPAPATYMKTLFTTWGAQLVIILVLFIGTLIMQALREAKARLFSCGTAISILCWPWQYN